MNIILSDVSKMPYKNIINHLHINCSNTTKIVASISYFFNYGINLSFWNAIDE